MELPPFYFSDMPVPPSKSVQQCHFYDTNKRANIPPIRDAYLESVLDPGSMTFKYALTAAHRGRVLRPLSTCLPFGSPNRVANLQDLCSGTMPFAVQAQQWLRDGARRKPVGRPRTGKRAKINSTGRQPDDADDADEFDEPAADRTCSEAANNRQAFDDLDSDQEVEDYTDVDPLVPFARLPAMPDYRCFKPYNRDKDRIEGQAKRATIHTGFTRLPALNSPINWWYSGGAVSYLPTAPQNGFLLHAVSGALSRVAAIPISLTDERSFQRIVRTEREPMVPVQAKTSIYQIESQLVEGDSEAFVYARLPDEVMAMRLDTSAENAQLTVKEYVTRTANYDYLTHLAASPYIPGEFLTVSYLGDVKFQAVGARDSILEFNIADMELKRAARYGWTGCYFGAHPRNLCVATPCAVEVFDGRMGATNSNAQLRLLFKGKTPETIANDITAACLFTGRDSYNVIATTREILVVDSRYTTAPVLRYPSQATTAPAYLRTLTDAATATDFILTGSQMSQQVQCFELDLAGVLVEGSGGSSAASAPRIATLPLLTATPRQLIAQAHQSDIWVEFSVRSRLTKPIIGMEAVMQPNGNGFTSVVISALGDLFLQPFETVDSATYDSDGVAAYSSVEFGGKLRKQERRHLRNWLAAADDEVMDRTRKDFAQPFRPTVECRVGEESMAMAEKCSAGEARKPNKLCRICCPNRAPDEDDQFVDDDAVCPRCHSRVKTDMVRRSTGDNNRFLWVEENEKAAPIPLDRTLLRGDRLREMALTNRVLWKVLTQCYHEDIPTSQLKPESREVLPPVENSQRTQVSSTERQQEIIRTILQRGSIDRVSPDFPRTNRVGELPETNGFLLRDPIMVSTQNDSQEATVPPVHEQPSVMAEKSAAKKPPKKPKRMSGF
ncbi:hypothetical protein BV898_14535 [Hypsibius exemplaris]|uniref:TAF1C beta-propeller domain-containing protein n=1 Tax=Hypsibius exemplaris TaxID=2072580 RepID=A0A9X6NIJ6_HYPEX|nr:hypothetical protein BV898_14535 [Hypsibius exemplaris]